MRKIPGSIIPDRTFVKLKFCQEGTLTTTGLAPVAYQTFRGNGPYDPDQTGAGLQPVGYDQWSQFYKRQRILGSKIRIQFLSEGTTASVQNWYCCIYPSEDVASSLFLSSAGFNAACVAPYARYKTFNISAPWACKMSTYMSTSKMLGQPKRATTTERDYSNVVGNNPIYQWYWNVLVRCPFAAGTINYRADITFYTEFFGRETQTNS